MMTTGRAQQPEYGPRRRRRRSRDLLESVAGRPEQLADVGRSDLELRGLNDYRSFHRERADALVRRTGLGDTRSYLCQSTWHVPGIALIIRCFFLPEVHRFIGWGPMVLNASSDPFFR